MARCSSPIVIPVPGMSDRPSHLLKGVDKSLAYPVMTVPCGKCMACVKVRQDSFACRINAEAVKRGSMCFVTLTYNDDNLPLAQTLWRVHRLTGEMEKLTDPELIAYCSKPDYYSYREDFKSIKASSFPRYLELEQFKDGPWRYVVRITPSVCRKDVQNWLKRVRIKYAREFDKRLDFSYAVCSEYGPRTCRPHYHLCFMGLDLETCEYFCREWKFGFTQCKYVQRVNADGSDGFSAAANYVGKYVSKGVFKCDSEKDCTALQCRMMTSKGLGSSIVEKYRDYMLAFDMNGAPYDPDTFWCDSIKRYLRRDEISNLIAEIPKRLAVSFDGVRYYAIPRVLRDKVFYVEKKSSDGKYTYRRPSKLWKMVVDSISRINAELHWREFEQFLSGYSPGKIREAVTAFNDIQEVSAKIANDSRVEDYQKQLAKSVF